MDDRILLLEPDVKARTSCLQALGTLGLTAYEVPSMQALLDCLSRAPSGLALLGLRAVGLTGLTEMRSRFPNVDCIVLSEQGTIAEATEVMRRGAFDYLAKPVGHDEIVLAVRRWR